MTYQRWLGRTDTELASLLTRKTAMIAGSPRTTDTFPRKDDIVASAASGASSPSQEWRSLPEALSNEFESCGLAHLSHPRQAPLAAASVQDPAAATLADFVLRNLAHREFPLAIEAIAKELGVEDFVLDESISAAGGLEFRNSKITIVYGDSDPALRRETIAHELGHYLLRNVAGIPFKDQLGDPGIEQFCDHFARNLLVPKSWLWAREPATVTIDVALEVSEITETSLAMAATALFEAQESWPAFLLLWQPRRVDARNWLVSHCVSETKASYRATPSTAAALSSAGRSSRRVTFSLVRNGLLCDATADVVRTGSSVATWVHHLRPHRR